MITVKFRESISITTEAAWQKIICMEGSQKSSKVNARLEWHHIWVLSWLLWWSGAVFEEKYRLHADCIIIRNTEYEIIYIFFSFASTLSYVLQYGTIYLTMDSLISTWIIVIFPFFVSLNCFELFNSSSLLTHS